MTDVFSFRRTAAMVLRYWYLLRSSFPRLIELIYWPAVQMLMWGFLQLYLAGNAGLLARASGTLIGAVLLWDILLRGQLGFSVSFELDYLNVLKMLELAGLPLLAEERDESYPLVIMGGPAPWVNPEAVAPFLDAVIIGEAEGLTDLLIPPIREYQQSGRGRDKRALLKRLEFLCCRFHGRNGNRSCAVRSKSHESSASTRSWSWLIAPPSGRVLHQL